MFAEYTDVESILQATFDAADVEVAHQAIRLATGDIRGWTGQHISPPKDETYTEHVVRASKVFLPHPPSIPVEVATVEVDDVAVDGWRLDRHNTIVNTSGTWTGKITVSYSHGFEDPPDDVVSVTVKLALRTLSNPVSHQSIKLEGFSATWGTGDENTDVKLMSRLDRYRMTGVA